MKTLLRIAVAAAAGALVMYFLDPDRGRRRRVQVRQRALAAGQDVSDFTRTRARHLAGRSRGLVARTRERFSHEELSDERLEARIRSRLGRLLERPGAVDVQVFDGRVVLSGHAGEHEMHGLLEALGALRGVERVDSRLTPEGAAGTTH